jgi:hypothetical protein
MRIEKGLSPIRRSGAIAIERRFGKEIKKVIRNGP